MSVELFVYASTRALPAILYPYYLCCILYHTINGSLLGALSGRN
jgi:hypothetical protein